MFRAPFDRLSYGFRPNSIFQSRGECILTTRRLELQNRRGDTIWYSRRYKDMSEAWIDKWGNVCFMCPGVIHLPHMCYFLFRMGKENRERMFGVLRELAPHLF